MSRHIVNRPITNENENLSKDEHRKALKHWFSKEAPVRRETSPVTNQNLAAFETLPCPPGVEQSYWQNLSKIEQIWTTGPVQIPTLEQRRALWQQQNENKTNNDSTTGRADYFSEAIRPADPFEEPVKRKAKLLVSKVEGNVVPFAPTEPVWRLASNE